MSMLARAATSSSVRPRCRRSSRSRLRTRVSTSSLVLFACVANELGTWAWAWASSWHGQRLGLCHRRRRCGRTERGPGAGPGRRRTLLVDAGEQSNLSAHGIGGLLGHDGRPPADFYAAGRRELAAYPSVEYRTGEVVAGLRVGGVFELMSADGRRERHRGVLLATGREYRPPSIPGLASLWGASVFHCPFCHGWEVRDQPLAVLANGKRAVQSSVLLRAWSDDVVLLTGGPAELDGDGRSLLAAAQVAIDERPVAELASRNGELEAVVFTDGTRLAR